MHNMFVDVKVKNLVSPHLDLNQFVSLVDAVSSLSIQCDMRQLAVPFSSN